MLMNVVMVYFSNSGICGLLFKLNSIYIRIVVVNIIGSKVYISVLELGDDGFVIYDFVFYNK